jgi:hypothetical protein
MWANHILSLKPEERDGAKKAGPPVGLCHFFFVKTQSPIRGSADDVFCHVAKELHHLEETLDEATTDLSKVQKKFLWVKRKCYVVN